MRSKLDELLDSPDFKKGVIDHDVGLMIYQNKLPLTYIILKLDGYYKVYLAYLDDDNDLLSSSKSTNLNVAKDLVTAKMAKTIRHLL